MANFDLCENINHSRQLRFDNLTTLISFSSMKTPEVMNYYIVTIFNYLHGNFIFHNFSYSITSHYLLYLPLFSSFCLSFA